MRRPGLTMAEDNKKDLCRLSEVNSVKAWCSRDKCIYWRLLESQDIGSEDEVGCGIQHFGLIDGLDQETAAWMLSMKRRLENITPETAKARISFRRREE